VPQLMVKEFLDQMVSNKVADSSRIYIGGLSLGAFGTYDMLIRYPHFFAAAFTICGAADIPQYTKEASHIPLWIFHGARDKTVPPETDRQLYKALKERGAKDVLYTEYEGVEHRSWHNAFAEPELLKWLFSKRKN
jgi:predicted peptidase